MLKLLTSFRAGLALGLLFLPASPPNLSAADSASPSSPPPASEVKKKYPPNLLAKEKSPYLLQHAHNPVKWHPWGDAAFALAKKENKPVLLSIGYSTCHWCHVMERESFEDEEIAKILNEHFIPIKLDREERPDVDNLYMTAMQALQMGGGWPLNVFITADRKPFFGGTYFKKPIFKQLLEKIAVQWKKDPELLLKDADAIAKGLQEMLEKAAPVGDGALQLPWVAKAAAEFSKTYDAKHGGFGDKPKFPQPQVAELILLQAFHDAKQEETAKVLHTCRRMAAGGMIDHLGGGFARYSVDETWLVPHFEKMLYDNAQLVHLYLNAHLLTGEAPYAQVAHDVLGYISRQMTSPEGGFYSAEDADSEGHEGKFYTWTLAELTQALSAEELALAKDYFTITDKGNFEDHSHPEPLKGQNILARKDPDKTPLPPTHATLAAVRQKLMALREKRVRPHLDDKVLTSWNGLMLGAMARAGAVLDEPKYREAAKKNFAYISTKMWDPATKTFFHRIRQGERDSVQLLSAYSGYLLGSVHHYEATLDPAVLGFCLELGDAMLRQFYDAKAGGFYSSAGASDLLVRVKDDYDGAEPSGNSQAIFALLKLAVIAERKDYREAAEKSLKFFSERLSTMGQAVPLMLQAMDFAAREPYRVVLALPEGVNPGSSEAQALLKAAHGVYQPNKVILGNTGPVEPFAKLQKSIAGKPTAYVCTGQACQPPSGELAVIQKYLRKPAK